MDRRHLRRTFAPCYSCLVSKESQGPSPLVGLNTEELSDIARSLGAPAYRGAQLAQWIYRKGVHSLDSIPILPRDFRRLIAEHWTVGRSKILRRQTAADGTFKFLLEFGDGAAIETVGLPYSDRFSCCVSTQVGCAIGCVFCATGGGGFSRNLSAGEIVDQVLTVSEVAEKGASFAVTALAQRVDHVTFMGMGEPLLNLAAVLKAISLLNEEMGIGARNITLSTSGLVPAIKELAKERLQITLAVSLHAPNDALRKKLMPGMTNWSVKELIEACRDYIETTGRRITFEYCLLDNLNDHEVEAQELARVLRGLNCHVNLIPFNAVGGAGLKPSQRQRVDEFRGLLSSRGIQVTQRFEKGSDIDAACGQLRRRHLRSEKEAAPPEAG